MTKQEARQLMELVSESRELREDFWKAMIGDRTNIEALAEVLREYVRDGGRLSDRD